MREPTDPEVMILCAALELPADQRAAFLDSACGADAALRREVDSLLRAAAEAGAFLESPAGGQGLNRPVPPASEATGDRIGPYRLLEQIGEGGFGVVYAAEQEEPVRRRVALKIIKLGMDTRHVIARFQAESRALALMDHPYIARVLDAGATGAGRPYFVMELVPGVRITDFCDHGRLSTEVRLRLFIKVCEAVQHAHLKGVIHRDIKPSNILVSMTDGGPTPKIIDFGVAKATQGRLGGHTLVTASGQVIGTPAYMSPEQAATGSTDIDTRTDIYSLGAVLHELLTGRTPFDPEELIGAGLDGMRSILIHREPLRPSVHLTLMPAEELRAVAGRRDTDGPRLVHLLKGDLDWILLKSLEKERARRYDTASALAADIQRHLSNEPVTVRPASTLYRLRKAVRRNKVSFGAAAAVAVALVAGMVGSVSQANRARRAEQEQIRLREQAERANRSLLEILALRDIRRAEDLLGAGDAATGLAALVSILHRDSSNQIAGNRLVSALVHRNWALPSSSPMHAGGKVDSVAFSSDGLRVSVACTDGNVQTWDVTSGLPVAITPHAGRLVPGSDSRDLRWRVTATPDGAIRVWRDGTLIAGLLSHDGGVPWADFSPDGARVLTVSADRQVRIWDSATGAPGAELRGQTNEIHIARFSPDARWVATAGKSAPLCIWSATTGERLFVLEQPQNADPVLCFSPDGQRLLASFSGRVRLWDPGTGRAIGPASARLSEVHYAAFSRDSRWFVTCHQDGAVRLWESERGESVGRSMLHDAAVHFAEFSPDGQLLATASADNSARVWHVEAGAQFCQPLRHVERVVQARFSPDGSSLVTGGIDGVVRVWNLRFRRILGLRVKHPKGVMALAFSPDGEALLTGSLDGTARLWNPRTGSAVAEPMQYGDGVEAVDFSRDGSRVLTGSNDGTAHIRDARTGRVIAGPLHHSKAIWSAQFSPDGNRVATASEDGTARLWDARTGHPLTPPLRHEAEVVSVRFHPDGRSVVTASKDFTARVWDAAAGTPIGEPLRHTDHLRWAEFSPDGSRILTASSDNSACVWDVRTSQRIAVMQHSRIVERATFSPDGRRVITASLDRTAKLWDSASFRLVTEPFRHEGPVSRGIGFSPDGARVATSAWNGSIRVWETGTGQPLTEWLDAGADVWTLSFDPGNRRLAVGTRTGSVRIWELPPVPVPVPEWFLEFAEVMAGIRLDPRGNSELIPGESFDAVVRQVASRPDTGFYEVLARWFLADPSGRPPSPF